MTYDLRCDVLKSPESQKANQIGMENAMAIRSEAIVSRLEAIATRVEAIAIRVRAGGYIFAELPETGDFLYVCALQSLTCSTLSLAIFLRKLPKLGENRRSLRHVHESNLLADSFLRSIVVVPDLVCMCSTLAVPGQKGTVTNFINPSNFINSIYNTLPF